MTTTEHQWATTDLLNDNIEGKFPADGKEHDYVVLAKLESARHVANGSSGYCIVEATLDLKSLFDKLNREYKTVEEEAGRSYSLTSYVFGENASQQVSFFSMIAIEGRLQNFRSSLI